MALPVSTKHSKHEPMEDTSDSNTIRCHLPLSLFYSPITQYSTVDAGMLQEASVELIKIILSMFSGQ